MSLEDIKRPRNTRHVIKKLQNNTKARYGSYSKESMMKDNKKTVDNINAKSVWLHLQKKDCL